jgi:hypothetical protein
MISAYFLSHEKGYEDVLGINVEVQIIDRAD